MRHIYTILLLICLFLSTSSSATDINGWDIQVAPATCTEKLVLEKDVETYTGDMIVSRIEYDAPAQSVLIIIPVTVSKKDTTAGIFDSMLFSLKNKDATFLREEDDTFLIDYEIRPLTQLKIKAGTHQGSIIFTVPKTMKQDSFTLYFNNTLVSEIK